MISKEEYLEIKDFLRHRVIEINRLDNFFWLCLTTWFVM